LAERLMPTCYHLLNSQPPQILYPPGDLNNRVCTLIFDKKIFDRRFHRRRDNGCYSDFTITQDRVIFDRATVIDHAIFQMDQSIKIKTLDYMLTGEDPSALKKQWEEEYKPNCNQELNKVF
jgi:hypothetical protein